MNTKINLDFECFKTKNYVFKIVNNIQIGIFKIKDDEFKVYEMICPHMGGDLCKGNISNNTIQCGWHGYIFSLETSLLIENPNLQGTKNARVTSKYYDLSECQINNLKLKNIKFKIEKNAISINI